jgi:hypothetical protein
MADEDLKSELERLRAENEALKRSSSKGLSMRVSEKGALSIYGLGRFPVTLYKEQWLRLLDMSDDIRTFVQNNETQLKSSRFLESFHESRDETCKMTFSSRYPCTLLQGH